jgi:guanine deaminase
MIDADDEKFMRVALELCHRGVEFGQSPFGSCIVCNGEVIAAAHNRVWANTDPTAHAEVVTLREAAEARGGISFADCTIYSTTEPCPMCFGAIHWARITRIVYGASVQDAKDYGFNELQISNQTLKEISGSKVELIGGVLREEVLDEYRNWIRRKDHRSY